MGRRGWGRIGFTMSLFVAGLAFGESVLLNVAKVGILSASVLAGMGGFLLLRGTSSQHDAAKGGVTDGIP